MNRVMKVRAWNKIDEVMITDLNSIQVMHGEIKSDPDDILMWFTGLKDKNCVEIYEGDVVKWSFGKHFWQAVIKTCFSHPEGQLYAIETINNVSTDESGDYYTYEITENRKGSRNEIAFLSKETEVIGNIHENPELLKD